MNPKIWLTILAIPVIYALVVMVVGFTGVVANAIHFSRVSLSVGVLILFLPALGVMFRQVPAPSRDYLLAGNLCLWLSASSFSIWNEAGRVFGVETNIFFSPIAGFFSLLLASAGVFHVIAPDTARWSTRIIAASIGIVVGIIVVFVAPLFR